jgi:Fe-S-cluster containining protein
MIEKDTEFKIKGLKIDPKIFTFKFSCRCTGECCLYGVFMDLKEAEKIVRVKKKLIPLFDETQVIDHKKWFETAEKDEDFESGVAVGTQVINHKCAFLDKNGLCTLQKLAVNEGVHMWKYKPIYCVLFPLTTFEGALTIDDEHIDRLKTCNKNPVPETTIYEACRAELKHFFGEEDFMRLENYRKEYLSSLKTKEVA